MKRLAESFKDILLKVWTKLRNNSRITVGASSATHLNWCWQWFQLMIHYGWGFLSRMICVCVSIFLNGLRDVCFIGELKKEGGCILHKKPVTWVKKIAFTLLWKRQCSTKIKRKSCGKSAVHWSKMSKNWKSAHSAQAKWPCTRRPFRWLSGYESNPWKHFFYFLFLLRVRKNGFIIIHTVDGTPSMLLVS